VKTCAARLGNGTKGRVKKAERKLPTHVLNVPNCILVYLKNIYQSKLGTFIFSSTCTPDTGMVIEFSKVAIHQASPTLESGSRIH
jgi:hypothetical protein